MNRKKNKREEESESFVTNRVGCGKTKWLERKKDARQSLIIRRNQRERKREKNIEEERIYSLLNCHRKEEKNVPLLHPNLFILSIILPFYRSFSPSSFLSFFLSLPTLLEPIVSHSWLVTHPNVNDSSSND